MREMVDAETFAADDPLGSDEPASCGAKEIPRGEVEPAESKEVSERKAVGTKEKTE